MKTTKRKYFTGTKKLKHVKLFENFLNETWKDKVQNVYSDIEELQNYDEQYDIVKRLGYEDVETLWNENPMIQGSTNPEDLKVVKESFEDVNEALSKTFRIGNLFLNPEHFVDKENKTIGKPAFDETILSNRKNATNKVTEAGEKLKKEVADYFKKEFNIDVYFKWNILCGCSACPCSPGFDVMVNSDIAIRKMTEAKRFTFFVKDDGSLDIRKPKDLFIVDDLKKMLNKSK